MGLIQPPKLTLGEKLGRGAVLKCNNFEYFSDQTTETHGTYKPHYRHVTPTEFKHLKIVVHLFYSLEKLISVLLPNSNEQMNKGEDYFILRCYCHLTFSMFQFVIA